MSPLVQDMLLAQHREDLELRNLEGLLEDECKCTSISHDYSECSIEVTHLFAACYIPGGKPVCEVTAEEVEMYQGNGSICEACDGFISHCWTIRPI